MHNGNTLANVLEYITMRIVNTFLVIYWMKARTLKLSALIYVIVIDILIVCNMVALIIYIFQSYQ